MRLALTHYGETSESLYLVLLSGRSVSPGSRENESTGCRAHWVREEVVRSRVVDIESSRGGSILDFGNCRRGCGFVQWSKGGSRNSE
jgi:hypothetical protein